MQGLGTGHMITIDGPAGSGKSTVSRLLAKRLGMVYLDTGAMYRAVAFAAARKGIHSGDGASLEKLCEHLQLRFAADGDRMRLFLDDEDVSEGIRSPEMDLLSSKVSAVREVRAAMTHLQRRMAEGTGAVAEGRDMGTVVFPDADRKFFLTASPETRVERRYRERKQRGEAVSKTVVADEMARRDEQDQSRALAPLKPAEDAVLIDTTHMTPEEVIEAIMDVLGSKEERPAQHGADSQKMS